MWAPDSQQHHGAVFASQYAALQAHEAACQPAQGARAPTQHSRPPLPSAPTAGPHAQAHAKTLQHSSLTLSLQAAGHGGQPALVPAAAGGRAPPPPHHALPPYLAQPAQAQAQLFAGGAWHAAYAAQVQQAAASQQLQQAAYGLAAGTAACHAFADPYGGAQAAATAAAVAAAAGWPAMQPHNSLALLHAQAQAAQAQAAALQQGQLGGGAAAVQQHSRRVRRRRGTARRSLLNLFDAVAASEEQSHSEGSDFESDSDCDMALCSQDSFASSLSLAAYPASAAAPAAGHGAAATPSPATPAAGAAASLAPSPFQCSDSGRSSPAGAPGTPGDERLLMPLQHLLLSERAQQLTALEVKAIIFKVASDLAGLHDAGVLHRHVTLASVALSRSGNLATARLQRHPHNVDAGQGRRYTGGKKAGVDAYLAPELARCPADCVAYTPAGDLWSLGVVLFVLLSGSHVPFGNRGLCWTSIPNMPGPGESVDKLQQWLEEHLARRVGVINQMRAAQERGKAPVGAIPSMRVVGLDAASTDLLLRLLAADPAARPTALQVLRHPWLAEVEGLMPSPHRTPTAAAPAGADPARPLSPEGLCGSGATPSPSFEARLQSAASDLACLGFSPATPVEDPTGGVYRLSSNLSAASSDCLFECPSGFHSSSSSAHASSACLADADLCGPMAAAAATGAEAAAQAAQPSAAQAASAGEPRSFAMSDGSTLQLLPAAAGAALAAAGLLPGPTPGGALPYRTLGFAVKPVQGAVEGRRVPLLHLHAVYDVDGQPMLAAEPVAAAHPHQVQAALHGAAPASSALRQVPVAAPAAAPAVAPATAPPKAQQARAQPASANPDLGTSAPILPLLARMLQQQQ